MKLILHLVDASFSPNTSAYTAIQPLHEPKQHIINLPVGSGDQTIKWLTLAAQQRLKQLHQHHGRVRQREPILGSSASYIPQGIQRETSTTAETPPKPALDPYAQINECFQDGDIIYLTFNQQMGCSISDFSSSAFYRHRFVEEEPKEFHDAESKQGEPLPPSPKIRDPSMFFERIFESDSQSTIETRPLMVRAHPILGMLVVLVCSQFSYFFSFVFVNVHHQHH